MDIAKKQKITEFIVAVIFLLVAAGFRLLPHAPNFTAMGALALFGGAYFSKRIALVLPVGAMLASDFFIGFYDFRLMAAVYGSFLLTVVLGFFLKKNKKWFAVGTGAVLSAVLFFLITNFAVWAFSSWYPKTITGLMQCYVMGLPFFKNTLLSSLFYSGVLFGGYQLARKWIIKKNYKRVALDI